MGIKHSHYATGKKELIYYVPGPGTLQLIRKLMRKGLCFILMSWLVKFDSIWPKTWKIISANTQIYYCCELTDVLYQKANPYAVKLWPVTMNALHCQRHNSFIWCKSPQQEWRISLRKHIPLIWTSERAHAWWIPFFVMYLRMSLLHSHECFNAVSAANSLFPNQKCHFPPVPH